MSNPICDDQKIKEDMVIDLFIYPHQLITDH